MNSERDATRTVRSWLEAGSTGMPDRVLDAVLDELPSRPQRRSMWWPRRYLRMKPIIPLAASAAVVVLAVVLGSQWLTGNQGVGGPAGSGSPAPSGSPDAFGGQITFYLGEDLVTLDVHGSAKDSVVPGTAKVSFGAFREAPELEDMFVIGLQCERQFDATTSILGGVIEESTHVGQTVGGRVAVILRDGSPQQLTFWFDDSPGAANCPTFVDGITDQAMQSAIFSPVGQGEIRLP